MPSDTTSEQDQFRGVDWSADIQRAGLDTSDVLTESRLIRAQALWWASRRHHLRQLTHPQASAMDGGAPPVGQYANNLFGYGNSR
jgi:hypothetical protein